MIQLQLITLLIVSASCIISCNGTKVRHCKGQSFMNNNLVNYLVEKVK